MKKALTIILVFLLIFSFSVPVYAEQTEGENQINDLQNSGGESPEPILPDISEPLGVAGSAEVSGLNRFLTMGESFDISGGYMTLLLTTGKPARISITEEMVENPPDTAKAGFYRSAVKAYGTEAEVTFLVLDKSKNTLVFEDVKNNFWGKNAIQKCVMASMFEGRSEKLFAISDNMTRAEFCQVLYNIYKDDKVLLPSREITFTDLKEGAWYVNAVNTCAKAGVVSGMGDGTFNPEGKITRQDAAVMMMSIIFGDGYIKNLDYEKTLESANKKGIAAKDMDLCSQYAKNSVAASLGVIYRGDNVGNINPKSPITRAEVASLFSEYFFKGYEEEKEETPSYLVYLSPSNQMSNAYANYDRKDPVKKQYTEGIQMQLVGDVVKRELEKMGYRVYVADVNTSIGDDNKYGEQYKEDGILSRAEEAAAMNADCYVAIHSNAAGRGNDGSAKGTKAFYNGLNEGAKELATAIYNKVAYLTPTSESKGALQEDISYSKDHGQTPYQEVWRPSMANLILEVEFHDYKQYADWIVANIEPLGIAIAEGIDEYFKNLK